MSRHHLRTHNMLVLADQMAIRSKTNNNRYTTPPTAVIGVGHPPGVLEPPSEYTKIHNHNR